MRYTKVLTLTVAAFFCFTLCANAQLGVGGAAKGATGVTGNLPTRSVKGTIDSTTQMTGDLQNGVNGNVNSAGEATAKTEKRKSENAKHEKSHHSKAANGSVSDASAQSAAEPNGTPQATSKSRGRRGEAGTGTDLETNTNANVAGTSAGASVTSSTSVDSNTATNNKSGNTQANAASSNTADTKVEHPHKAQKDPFLPQSK